VSIASNPLPQRLLDDRLRPFRRRAIGVMASNMALLACFGLILALVGAMWLDTIWALPAAVRWAITRPILAANLVGLVGILAWRSMAIKNEHLADWIDNSQATGGEILAGWQLANRPVSPSGDLTESMAMLAVRRAGEKVGKIAPSSVIGNEMLHRSFYYVVGAIAVTGMISLIVPDIARNQIGRFLHPARDIPPYTGTTIELQLERAKILYGEDVIALAVVDRGLVDRMTLVSRTMDGREARLPMLAESTSQFRSILTRVTEPLDLYAVSGTSRSRVLHLDVTMTPQILPPQVVITAPEYTRQAVYRGGLPKQGLRGLVGTEVEWEVKSNRPLAEGRLSIEFEDGSSEHVLLNPSKATVDDELGLVSGSLTLSRSGTFRLSVIDTSGIESYESVEGAITIVDDQRPIVRIVQPKPISVATPDVVLPVTISAEDDFGISSLALYRSLNGSPSSKIVGEIDGDRREEASWQLPLADYGLTAGDEIQLFARAEDNDPAGPKGSESPVTVIRIISVQQFQEMMLQRRGAESMQAKYQQARRYLEQLANAIQEIQDANEQLAANPQSPEAREALEQKLAEARQRAREASQAIEKLSRQAMPVDVDQELAKRLAEMSELANQIGQQLDGIQPESDQPLTEAQQQQLEKMLAETRDGQDQLTDQAIEPMEKMQKMLPLVMDQQRFVRLTEQQRDLANRLQSLKEIQSDKPDAETTRRVAELEAEQEQLRQGLSDLLDDIQRHANDLPDDPELDDLRTTSLDFADAVRQSMAQTEMSTVQQQLLDGQFPNAEQSAANAAEILESFLSENDGMGNKACENCKAAFKPGAGGAKLGNSLEQMMAMMGMKPGASGSRPGGNPGSGFGFGAGGGFAQRFPGPENVGIYGSLPNPTQQPSRGQGDSSSGTVASSLAAEMDSNGGSASESGATGSAGGQGLNNIPTRYRSQVADYFKTIADELGNLDSSARNP
jgi:hypothetical protein